MQKDVKNWTADDFREYNAKLMAEQAKMAAQMEAEIAQASEATEAAE